VTASLQPVGSFLESLLKTSNGLPPPDELSTVSSGISVGVSGAADLPVGVDGSMTVEVGASGAAVDVALDAEVEASSDSSVSVSVAASEVVDEGRTVVSVSGPLLEVRMLGVVRVVGSAVGRLLGLGVGVSRELLGQSICTVFPINTCPSTDVGEASASPQAARRRYWALVRPLTQDSEHGISS
jgi:hypothetical protein